MASCSEERATVSDIDDVAPGLSKTMDAEFFAELREVDPVLFDRSYWLGPDDEKSDRAYVLLRDALAELEKVAVARNRGKPCRGCPAW
ncbi:Ku protein [Amycolatopsis sp. GM8]|uniref:Ku protein n=1 Tax=Amycolatopsis sp. GM8 TaxID=2896530 RepID=UPI001F4569A9|nr:Ku protein [Amycolatopsis sp. GM8]